MKASLVIKDTILGMDKPFNMSDLYCILKEKHSITNRMLIHEVVDGLCDAGFLEFKEIYDNVFGFEVA